MAKNGKFIIGALLGALFGLAFAPKKGSELRKELQNELAKGGKGEKTLKDNARLIKEDISETAQEVYHDPKVQAQFEAGKKEASKLVKKVQEELQSSGNEWVHIAREKLQEGVENIHKEANKTIDTLKKVTKSSQAKPQKNDEKPLKSRKKKS